MGEPVKIVDLADKMIRLSGKEPGRDIVIEFVGARPGEKLHEELVGYGEGASPTTHEAIMQVERAPVDPAWLAVELSELERLVDEGDTLEVVGTLARLVREPRRTALAAGAAEATPAAETV